MMKRVFVVFAINILLLLGVYACSADTFSPMMSQDVMISFDISLDQNELVISNISDSNPDNGDSLSYIDYSIKIGENAKTLRYRGSVLEGEPFITDINSDEFYLLITVGGCNAEPIKVGLANLPKREEYLCDNANVLIP